MTKRKKEIFQIYDRPSAHSMPLPKKMTMKTRTEATMTTKTTSMITTMTTAITTMATITMTAIIRMVTMTMTMITTMATMTMTAITTMTTAIKTMATITKTAIITSTQETSVTASISRARYSAQITNFQNLSAGNIRGKVMSDRRAGLRGGEAADGRLMGGRDVAAAAEMMS